MQPKAKQSFIANSTASLFNTGFDTDSFETVYVLKEVDLYYAFNKSIPDNIIKQFQINLEELKSNGEYQKISVSKLITVLVRT